MGVQPRRVDYSERLCVSSIGFTDVQKALDCVH